MRYPRLCIRSYLHFLITTIFLQKSCIFRPGSKNNILFHEIITVIKQNCLVLHIFISLFITRYGRNMYHFFKHKILFNNKTVVLDRISLLH